MLASDAPTTTSSAPAPAPPASGAPTSAPVTQSKARPARPIPAPSPAFSAVTKPLVDALMLRGIPGLRRMPGLSRVPGLGPLVRGFAHADTIAFDRADRARFAEALAPDRGVIVAPNHAEFFTDFMVDKWLMDHTRPLLACYTDPGIMAGPLGFAFRKHHMLAARNDAATLDYMVAQVTHGRGALLHPEGDVTWNGRTVAPLFSGVADLALAAAARGTRVPTIVPVAYRYAFAQDARPQLTAMGAHVARSLGFPRFSGPTRDAAGMFAHVFTETLRVLATRYGHDLTRPDHTRPDHTRHDRPRTAACAEIRAHRAQLLAQLWQRVEDVTGPLEGTMLQRVRRAHRALRTARDTIVQAHGAEVHAGLVHQVDVAKWLELTTPDSLSHVLARSGASQDDVYKHLRRLNQYVLTGRLDGIRAFLPVAPARRTIRITTGEPVCITPAMREMDPAALLNRVREAQQAALDRAAVLTPGMPLV